MGPLKAGDLGLSERLAKTMIPTGQAMSAKEQSSQGSHACKPTRLVSLGECVPSSTRMPDTAAAKAAAKNMGRSANAMPNNAIAPMRCLRVNGWE
jgi:hypothetical protein